ncbi:uncharacterized protein PAC_19481 [Phialocephala subalpina]|uniref:C2H2-type domain-containing protein n=1 Tax=Phialocephala subalpina TaxID=576137 RepID=A0A1L7XWZ9_9HELO|nr:uncharacterized protein PAC_19481 [Phialocephala subalpina]
MDLRLISSVLTGYLSGISCRQQLLKPSSASQHRFTRTIPKDMGIRSLLSPDQPFYPNLSGSVTYSDRTDVNVNPPNVSFSRVGETGESSKNDTAFVGQKCQYPNCPETRIFKQDSVFKQHLRPYKCPIPTCTVTPFATPGDLKRHEREVHSTPTFTCPITSCRRHRRGFGRKDNLVQHLQRVHDQEVDGMTSSSPPALNLDGGFSNKDSFTGLGRVISNSNTTSTDLLITSMSSPSEKTTLMAKLQQLEMEKVKAMAKFDGDIAALKRVLSFM